MSKDGVYDRAGIWRGLRCRGRRGFGRCDAAARRIVGFPFKPLGVQALLETVRPIDPRAVAVGKSRPVVGLSPDEEASRGLLHAIANGIVVLVFQALADDVVTDKVTTAS